MKLLILGKNGQVGWELVRALQSFGEVLALDRSIDQATDYCGDVTNYAAIQRLLDTFQPDVVVNATAYTAVDKAETEREQADLVNHLAVKNLAEKCLAINALLIHYSTDYVFNGLGAQPWLEDDATTPINYYGESKRNGELALESSGVKFINFRTSWVYGTHGSNFIKTMLQLAQSRDALNVIDDQIGAPTGAALIADVTAQVIRYYVLNRPLQSALHGHYHLAAQGATSWFGYAQYIFTVARSRGAMLKIQQLSPIATSQYPTAAKRPLNSRLNTQKLQHTFDIHLPNWELGVEKVIREIV